MHPILAQLVEGLNLTGKVQEDMVALLVKHGDPHTVGHSLQVAAEARSLAERFKADPSAAETAGWLHDISAVIPVSVRLPIAAQLGLEILPEEALQPNLLHQKLSAVMAREIFRVADPGALSAIGVHITLKPGASTLDKIVFVADKLRWDQPGIPPYLEPLQSALEAGSLDRAALAYLKHLWQNRASLPGPLHPWAEAAYHELEGSQA